MLVLQLSHLSCCVSSSGHFAAVHLRIHEVITCGLQVNEEDSSVSRQTSQLMLWQSYSAKAVRLSAIALLLLARS